MQQPIRSALISVYYKDGLLPIATLLQQNNVTIYSTGGTQQYLASNGISVTPVESLTGFPSILGGRVKTLHPLVFGGILGRRDLASDLADMQQYQIPVFDLVMVDLYPFEETVAKVAHDESLTAEEREQQIIEKIDIGGPSMIRAAAKNHAHVAVTAGPHMYPTLLEWLQTQNGTLNLAQRRSLAMQAFDVCTAYDTAISGYFQQLSIAPSFHPHKRSLRYGENPHQRAVFQGDWSDCFDQLHGKEISYNNLVDIDAAMQLMQDFDQDSSVFAIIKHTNVCGVAQRRTISDAWQAALAGDPESAFGGVLIANQPIDVATAKAISDIFFEVLLAPGFDADALSLLQSKKNRILLQTKAWRTPSHQSKSILNGILVQETDHTMQATWEEKGGRSSTETERIDLDFANRICKHLKSNAIALVKDQRLIGKGCGQTSRIDALRQALEKARQFEVNLQGAVMASDAFFPFADCAQLAHEAGIQAIIQPGGSIRDQDTIDYCQQHQLALVITGTRHFRH